MTSEEFLSGLAQLGCLSARRLQTTQTKSEVLRLGLSVLWTIYDRDFPSASTF
jgi:hypothetical protein